MATNRLFIYDAQENIAVCIAKGYSSGWFTCGNMGYMDEFFDEAQEFTGQIDSTRYKLLTEPELPKCKIIWSDIDGEVDS